MLSQHERVFLGRSRHGRPRGRATGGEGRAVAVPYRTGEEDYIKSRPRRVASHRRVPARCAKCATATAIAIALPCPPPAARHSQLTFRGPSRKAKAKADADAEARRDSLVGYYMMVVVPCAPHTAPHTVHGTLYTATLARCSSGSVYSLHIFPLLPLYPVSHLLMSVAALAHHSRHSGFPA